MEQVSLHEAVARNKVEVVKKIIAERGELNAVDDHGRTALMVGLGSRGNQCVRPLVEAGASVNIRDVDGFRPIHYVCHSLDATLVEVRVVEGSGRRKV